MLASVIFNRVVSIFQPNMGLRVRMVNPRYIITWLHVWNIEYKNTLDGCRDLNGLGVERTADESSSSLCWCMVFTASTLHSLCPDIFLNAYAGGWMVNVWFWIVARGSWVSSIQCGSSLDSQDWFVSVQILPYSRYKKVGLWRCICVFIHACV